MISAKILRKKDNIIGFIIDSHAMPEDRDFNNDVLLVGEAFDMVCNSVSVLSQSVLIGIDEVLKLNCTYEMADGYLKLDLTNFSEEELKQSQVLLKTFEKSLESVIFSLDEMFGINKRREYINLLKEEV